MALPPDASPLDDDLVIQAMVSGIRRRRRRRRAWIAGGVVAAVLIAAGATAGIAWWVTDARERALAERAVTSAQQAVVTAAVEATAEVSAQIDSQKAAYRSAVAVWQSAEQTAASFQGENTAATASAPNPGGASMPGGDADARALLDGIGGAAVQIVYDGGPQNCGYSAADENFFLALGGCYDSRFRNTVFLAWDSGARRSDIWPIFVHEAMHWYQWDRFSTYFAAADGVGVGQDAYRTQIESDASCRAVVQHGVPASAYEGSSAPCDVAGWHENWLVEQLAGLGVPTAAPDPEAFEVREVTRP
ncbi:hypothetical protein ACTU3I_07475 [Microbacterium sp. RD1]|uniref:hypothetical protein n=1 Tax=Microbacterium sp. RD1 TaxID=3457313 RepID=UPI003FA529AE